MNIVSTARDLISRYPKYLTTQTSYFLHAKQRNTHGSVSSS